MRPGWNPTRRNRNIGTAKQGHGQNNRLTIPKSWPDDRVFWEVLVNPIAITRMIQNQEITFIVEPAYADWFYPCTVDDVAQVLSLVPEDDLEGIELIIFRQPTRKQNHQNYVWGRFLYYPSVGQYSGTAICLEAQCLSKPLRWPLSLGPESTRELGRLRADGHIIHQEKRHYRIESNPETLRNTVLFRTILHELGHYVDWVRSVILPSLATEDDGEDERIHQEFDTKPSAMREDFAHRYAAELFTKLRAQGKLPFPHICDPVSMDRDGLEASWFTSY
jgi:hypothetical protein